MEMTGKYVDGFVLPVPKKNIDAYKGLVDGKGHFHTEHSASRHLSGY